MFASPVAAIGREGAPCPCALFPKTLGAAILLAPFLIGAAPCLGQLSVATDAAATSDSLELAIPRHSPSAVDLDRLEAAHLYARGRLLLQQEEFAAALSQLQRAWRLDAHSPTILEDIVTTAQSLGQSATAERYAVLLAEARPADGATVARAVAKLVDRDELPRAVRLLEAAMATRERAGGEAPMVSFYLEHVRLQSLLKNYPSAAESGRRFLQALEDPARYRLEAPLVQAIEKEAGSLYGMIGEVFLRAGQPGEALAAFRKAHEAQPNRVDFHFHEAECALATGDRAAARASLERVLAQNHESLGFAPYRLLTQLSEPGPAREADKSVIGRLEKLQMAQPENLPVRLFLAQQYQRSDQLDRARAQYEQILGQTPAIEALRGLLDVYRVEGHAQQLLDLLGSIIFRLESVSSLGGEYQHLVENGELARKVIGLAVADLERDANKQSGAPSANPPAEAGKGEPATGNGKPATGPTEVDPARRRRAGQWLAASQLAMALRDWEVSDQLFHAAWPLLPSNRSAIAAERGLAWLLADQPARAVVVFQKALEGEVTEELRPAFLYYLASALELSGKTDEALVAARKAIAGDQAPAGFAARGPWILYHARRYSEAEAGYRAFLGKYAERTDDEARDALRDARLVLSNLCVISGRTDEGERLLEEVLNEFPEDVGASNDLGYLWADRDKHLPVARRLIEFAVAAEPGNEAYRDSLGWVLFRLGLEAESQRELERATAGNSPDGVALSHLAEVLWKRGEHQRARELWDRALTVLEKQQDHHEYRKLQERLRVLNDNP